MASQSASNAQGSNHSRTKTVLVGQILLGFADFLTTYEGKPLPRWIRRLEYENVNPADKPRQALRGMGGPAAARLLTLLESRDSAIKGQFAKYAGSHANISESCGQKNWKWNRKRSHAEARSIEQIFVSRPEPWYYCLLFDRGKKK